MSELDALTGLPRDAGGPVFAAPWQAHAFAMALALHEHGVFAWSEWAATLSSEIQAAQRAGDPDLGDTYYDHWLKALESMVAAKGIASAAELGRYARAWQRAAERTAHGAPIVLGAADLQD